MDADPTGPAPRSIGQHSQLIELHSGDPAQIAAQRYDAAIFEITLEDLVSSIQGDNYFDTPAVVGGLTGGREVKRVGRTTGLTHGTVIGRTVAPLAVPYRSSNLAATVYFEEVYAIEGKGGGLFSAPGDSGSLIVSEDGNEALGLLFAGSPSLTYVVPLEPTLKEFGVSIVSGHGQ